MPTTRESHVIYTRNELTNYKYYIDVINVLKKEHIKTYLDIGANVGEVCNYLFETFPTLQKAFLIEPEDENYNFILTNVKNLEKVEIYKLAIGYDFKNPKLVNHESGNVGGFFLSEGDSTSPNVKVTTLEKLEIPIVDLVKIDVEGLEYNIIENSSYLQEIEWIEIEFHGHSDKSIIDYVNKYFPNHTIIVLENIGGRCLLKKI